jgi:hypothetical protein
VHPADDPFRRAELVNRASGDMRKAVANHACQIAAARAQLQNCPATDLAQALDAGGAVVKAHRLHGTGQYGRPSGPSQQRTLEVDAIRLGTTLLGC